MSGFMLKSSASAAVGVLFVFTVLVFAGLVLPAVWSRKPTRRAAAVAVLQQILDFVRAVSRR